MATVLQPTKVVISYSRKNADAAQKLIKHLETKGFEVWYDQNIPGGKNWWDAIIEAINQCHIFIVVLSDDYLKSIPCEQELKYAEDLGKNILPILVVKTLDPTIPLPTSLNNINRKVFNVPQQATKHIEAIVKDMQTLPIPQLPAIMPSPPAPPIDELISDITDALRSDKLASSEQAALIASMRFAYEQQPGRGETILQLLNKLDKHKQKSLDLNGEIQAFRQRITSALSTQATSGSIGKNPTSVSFTAPASSPQSSTSIQNQLNSWFVAGYILLVFIIILGVFLLYLVLNSKNLSSLLEPETLAILFGSPPTIVLSLYNAIQKRSLHSNRLSRISLICFSHVLVGLFILVLIIFGGAIDLHLATRILNGTSTPTPTITPSPTATATDNPTNTPTDTPTATIVPTNTPSSEPTATTVPTDTPIPATATTAPTIMPTVVIPPTLTPIPATFTPTATATPPAGWVWVGANLIHKYPVSEEEFLEFLLTVTNDEGVYDPRYFEFSQQAREWAATQDPALERFAIEQLEIHASDTAIRGVESHAARAYCLAHNWDLPTADLLAAAEQQTGFVFNSGIIGEWVVGVSDVIQQRPRDVQQTDTSVEFRCIQVSQ